MRFKFNGAHLPGSFFSPLLKSAPERTASVVPVSGSPAPLRRAPPVPPHLNAGSQPAGAGTAPGWLSSFPLRPRLWRPPTRLTVGLPGCRTHTVTSAMPLPMQRDGARGAGTVLPGDKPSKVIIEAEARAAAGIDAIHPLAHPETGLPMSPGTLRALGDEAGLRHEVAVMFGTSMAARALADRLAAFVPGDADGDRHAPALMLATALRSVGIEDPAYAARVLDAADRGDTSRELFRLERLLAATAEGTSALAHLRRWPEDEAGRGTRRDALLLCSDLEAKGFPVGGHDSVDSVVRALRARPDARLDTPVGTADDTPLQLLAQALVHCR